MKYDGSNGKQLLAMLELDTATGLMYCAESEDIYFDVLEEFMNDDKAEELSTFFAERNWERYRISIHAVKSSSLTIGATEVYDVARFIEEPLKNMDYGPALDLHDAFIVKYCDLMSMLHRVLD